MNAQQTEMRYEFRVFLLNSILSQRHSIYKIEKKRLTLITWAARRMLYPVQKITDCAPYLKQKHWIVKEITVNGLNYEIGQCRVEKVCITCLRSIQTQTFQFRSIKLKQHLTSSEDTAFWYRAIKVIRNSFATTTGTHENCIQHILSICQEFMP